MASGGPSPEQAASALAEVGLAAEGVAGVEALAGGVSNLTYRVERRGAGPVVLRVQRAQGIFEPYDVLREARVIAALAGTEVPVPAVLATADGSAALGAPFFVMEFVDAPHMGQVARSPAVTQNYVRSVAAIHALDWRAAGLDFLDPPRAGRDAAARDLAAVSERARRYGHERDPLVAELGGWLAAHHPAATTLALCQGDINVFNYLFEGEEVVAVVDWEQARIADPQSDLGLLAALSYFFGGSSPPREQPIMSLYAQHTGAALEELPYYVLAALHKLAVIHRIWSELGETPPWYSWSQVEEVTAMVLEMAESADGA